MRLYLHIPFCLRKCPYCDFASFSADGRLRSVYLEALLREIRLHQGPEAGKEPLRSLYIGGGTPSLYGPRELARLVEGAEAVWGLAPGAEVSVEVNPATWGEEEWGSLVDAGFNRVSIGVQSFDRLTLRRLGRPHGAEEARAAAETALAQEGLQVNLDLMYGVPGQAMQAWKETLEEALSLAPHHLSLYLLTPEPSTPLEEDIRAGRVECPGEDDVAAMYEEACLMLAAGGYRHYEISNFAMPGFECRHNRAYWRREAYLGLGLAAHSFRPPDLRWSNTRDMRVYLEDLGGGRLPRREEERLTPGEVAYQEAMLSLRTSEGMPLPALPGRDGGEEVMAFLRALEAGGLAWSGKGRWGLTERGMFVSNLILADLPIG